MKDNFAFQLAVHQVQQRDTRYSVQGYAFICDSLAHTVRMLERDSKEDQHVAGPELLQGLRDLALDQFGPLALLVLNDWGIRCSEDVGNMVYNMIEVGYFGKNESDRLEDFSDGVSLDEFLTKPFRAKK